MEKNIKDYLHLYLGCEVLICINIEGNRVIEKLDAEQLAEEMEIPIGIKPILRPLSDMTEGEADIVGCEVEDGKYNKETVTSDCIVAGYHHITEIKSIAEVTKYLLSKHFDLFGLIDAGLAIDKTTLK